MQDATNPLNATLVSLRPQATRPVLLRYGSAVASVALMTLVKLSLEPTLENKAIFLALTPAVAFSAWFGGFGPGLLAIALGMLSSAYLFLPPTSTFALAVRSDLTRAVLYIIVGVFMTLFIELQRLAAQRIMAHTREVESQRDRLEQEIQERKKAEAALRESEERAQRRLAELDNIYNSAPVGLAFVDTDLRFVRINERLAAINGRPVADHIGHRPRQILPDLADQIEPFYRQVIESGTPILDIAVHGVTSAEPGVERDWLVSYHPVIETDGTTLGVNAVVQEITALKRAEEDLRRKEEHTRAVLNSLFTFVSVLTPDGLFAEANRAAAEAFSLEPEVVVGKSMPDIFPWSYSPTVQAQLREAIQHAARGEMVRYDVQLPTDGGQFAIVDFALAPLFDPTGCITHLIASGIDITERKRLEEQLIQAQKMESIGRLAGGIAHDFNNYLSVILGYSEFAQRKLTPDNPAHRDLQQVQRASERASNLTRQLLAFARRQVSVPVVVDLNDLIVNIDKMLRRLIDEDIELVTALAPSLWTIKADIGQIEQVLVNLAVNARDAMPNGGKLIIETANAHLSEDDVRRQGEVVPGEYVMLTVSDTGVGMDEEVKAHIFEPFFTKKEVGKGTGLGLATCYGIVTQNSGQIAVYSELGHGTTFKIYLPRAEEAPAPIQRDTSGTLPQGTETILVAEDESLVRDIARTVLRAQGYTVLEAANGEEALRLAQDHPGEIHLLLTDVVMPQMGGKELAERLGTMRPDIKVLYTSGYTNNVIGTHGILDAETAFLQKPVTPDVLARKVRDVLDS